MVHLTIELLGPPRLTLVGDVLTLRMRKELALLAYLGVEQQHPQRRDTLLGLLWPDVTEETARNNLRVLLAGLRRLLGEAVAPRLRRSTAGWPLGYMSSWCWGLAV